MVDSSSNEKEFWLFGYGSLIWKPPPHFDEFQATSQASSDASGSEDHRGTPVAPGRVVTLIERSFWETLVDHHTLYPDAVWGVAYRIDSSKKQEVQAYLDFREINGYSIQYTPFHPADSSQPVIDCLVYIGLPSNPQFLGVQDPQKLAEHIYRSRGPSGENKEYLYMLDTALEDLSRESGDEHIQDLARRVREIEYAARGVEDTKVGGNITNAAVHRSSVIGTDEQRGNE